MPTPVPPKRLPKVYIVGGGFAGIEAAKALAKAPVEVTLVDRRNHHVFQPLLYQVATASLSPADIAVPIRRILRGQQNTRVVLAKMTGVDTAKKQLLFERGAVAYDYLIMAAGVTHSYFGHDEWAPIAPGLKNIQDATEIRRRLLLAFESAEYEGDDSRRRAALTFAIVGGGPTGVELAGAIKEIAAQTMQQDFHYIDTKTTRVVLLQGDDRVLPQFPEKLSERAKKDLERMGVEVRVKARVTNVTRDGVYVGNEFIPVRTVFWAAGVRSNSLSKSMGVPLDKAGRVIVNPDLTIPGHPEVFVVGDMASLVSPDTKKPVPGVAQAAMQMGKYAARVIASEVAGKSKPADRKPFVYNDKGSMATIGKAKAVADIKGLEFGGLLAWLAWGLIHVMFLVGFRNRVAVVFNWIWSWLVNARDVRLILGEERLDINTPRPGELILAEQGKAEQGEAANPVKRAPAAEAMSGAMMMGEPKM